MHTLTILAPLLVLLAACSDSSAPAPAPSPEVLETESPAAAPVEAGNAERAAVAAASGLPQPTVATELLSCETVDGISAHCGYQNPEDLVLTPDGALLLVSEMGEFMMDTPGALSTLSLASGDRASIEIDWSAEGDRWGDPACPAPDIPAFSPHGIDLITRADGRHQLLVVNHGLREAVEFFELIDNDDAWQLAWRGCALPPGDPFINDVAALQDGGFFLTHMWDKRQSLEAVGARLLNGEATGWVWEWQDDTGFSKVPGSDQLMPNGIAVDAANEKLFVNVYFGNKTVRIDRASGTVDGEFEVRQPDNITVDADGTLWVASHRHDALGQSCAAVTEGPCLLPYEIVRADADTLETEVVVQGDGAPMGYTTVALRVDDRLYMGSAHGDRVASIDLPGAED